ncbi:MAG: cell wall hydrolase [Limnochordia bacterium]|jgi:N-acetylmuramoyl-L-alanine amidase
MPTSLRPILLYLLIITVIGGLVQLFIPAKPPLREEKTDLARLQLEGAEIELVARLVHAESRGEPYEGQVAVAAVVFNRVEHPAFPDTVAGVIYQPQAFSVVADGQLNLPYNDQAMAAVHDALNGWDPTDGALYFYNPVRARSSWLRKRPIKTTIGKHIFAE